MRRLRLAGAVALALTCLALGASVASADFTPTVLLSGSTTVEADYAYSPVVSGNGLYAVYVGSQAGVTGIYRKNLQSGALDLVAAGPAGAPSVSADGRYVSFTTTATDPSTGSGSQCSTVYVRDMSSPISVSGAFTVVSALDGSSAPLVYAGTGTSGCPGGGSAAADGVAISADGNEVAFTVVGTSDLTTRSPAAITTPGAQVVVRNLTGHSTTLVSQTQASLGVIPEPVTNGAAVTDNSTGVGSTAGTLNAGPGDSTAAISADGSTVSWEGINIPSQAPASTSDAPHSYPAEYDEPLWRRIADGPSAPTRRVLGGDDPGGCPSACQGPLDLQWQGESPEPNGDTGPDRGSFIAYQGFRGATANTRSTLDDATPRLSADGQRVAVLSTQPATGQDPVCSNACSQNVAANAYVVNMDPALNRTQALTRVTAWASTNFDVFSLAGPIEDMAISPEGDRVAFSTVRTVFPYSPPALITPQLSGAAYEQLYVADLGDGTLSLASLGYDGHPANGPVLSPSFSAANGPIVFSSSATNLVYGAFSGLAGGGQVFSTSEIKPPATPGVETISPPPANPLITPDYVIGVSARATRTGSVILSVTVPGSGKIRATARAGIPVAAGAQHVARRSRHSRTRRSRHRLPVPVRQRTVARGSTTAAARGVTTLTLRAAPAFRVLARRLHGLYATVTVTFTSPAKPTLSQRVPVDFTIKPRKGKS